MDIMKYSIKLASIENANEISELIHISAKELSKLDYSSDQIEATLKGVWGLDSQLVADKTYYVILFNNQIVGCGGWSFRKTLFGGDGIKNRNNEILSPKTDAAKIRAFFIHPEHVRKGLGRKLLIYCEQQAWDYGFTKLELGATLSGKRLYSTLGYIANQDYEFEAFSNVFINITPMTKILENRPV